MKPRDFLNGLLFLERQRGKKIKQMFAWEAHYLHIRILQLSPKYPVKVRTSVKTMCKCHSLITSLSF